MTIMYEEERRRFYLHTKNTSYVLDILASGHIAHVYWGSRIASINGRTLPLALRAFSPYVSKHNKEFSLDTLPQEYPGYGHTDFREPAFEIEHKDGSTLTPLTYVSHTIETGKYSIPGLPAVYHEQEDTACTLRLVLSDASSGVHVCLLFSTIDDYDVITRSTEITNRGADSISINRLLSASVDLFLDNEVEVLTLSGSWGRERRVERRKLSHGTISVESRRGASSHQMNPFLAIMSPETTEDTGDVFGFSLVYSGNFRAFTERDQYDYVRAGIGINPFDFTWHLEPGETFHSPEAVLVHTAHGLGEMSRIYHRVFRERLIRGQFRDSERPVLINNWEATYFDFDEDSLKKLAQEAAEIGVELFVLDDGWFGERNRDDTSLGDWTVNTKKLPNGLSGLADSLNRMGLKFGLWFEPEMVSPRSRLYEQHPDWAIHVKHRERSEARQQLVLDLSRADVQDYLITSISEILKSANIEYVKWDMNRHLTEIGSAELPRERQRETAHRHILGLYRVLEHLTTQFPHILFESCSGGGGRFDPGMLFYMPQTWTSDNTDAISRLFIQEGTSIVYPAISMGSHVSAVPNHQVGRVTPLQARGHVAMAGNLGYELDLTKLSASELTNLLEQIQKYKSIRKTVQFGTHFRLRKPDLSRDAAWMYVSADQSEAVVTYIRVLNQTNAPFSKVRLKGLDPNRVYQVVGTDEVYRGDELMHVGMLVPPADRDYQSIMWHLREQE